MIDDVMLFQMVKTCRLLCHFRSLSWFVFHASAASSPILWATGGIMLSTCPSVCVYVNVGQRHFLTGLLLTSFSSVVYILKLILISFRDQPDVCTTTEGRLVSG